MIYDAIVIGAGPAGCIFSHLMAKQGNKILILERQSEIKRKVCGEYLCPEGVKSLRELDLNHVLSGFKHLNGMIIHSPKGRVLDTNFPASYGHSNYGVSVNREVFDNRLLSQAMKSGAQVKMGTTVVEIKFNSSFWQIKTSDGGEFYCRLLIGADGRNSFVAKSLNLKLENEKKNIALHAWLPCERKLPRKGQMFIFDEGCYIGVDPINDKEVNISLVCQAKHIKKYGSANDTFEFYLNKIKDQIGVSITKEIKVHTSFPIEHSVSDIIKTNVALIGDAAGFVDPITGEGIFNAIKTAHMLVQSLEDYPSLVSFEQGLLNYKQKKELYFKEKTRLNKGFQWLIRSKILVEIVAAFINLSQKKRDAFIGIIGNIYTPFRGVMKMIF
ncbi:NAD(P)/FAD-dependent oxidoreductase [Halobacteriovorax sp.]|uniref:NAD(P)/FAD-dependent oxidoreductase n=1 Tax=Halobacteriovorax sp. TaxID=2020862 RepID=UPI003AF254AD